MSDPQTIHLELSREEAEALLGWHNVVVNEWGEDALSEADHTAEKKLATALTSPPPDHRAQEVARQLRDPSEVDGGLPRLLQVFADHLDRLSENNPRGYYAAWAIRVREAAAQLEAQSSGLTTEEGKRLREVLEAARDYITPPGDLPLDPGSNDLLIEIDAAIRNLADRALSGEA